MKRFRPNLSKYFILIFTIIIFIYLINLFIEKTTKNEFNQNIKLGGSFVLVDSKNKVFSSKDLKKKKIVYFGYTFCPDVCPLDLTKLSNIYDQNTNLNDTIQPIFISLDPERDKANILDSYLENFNSNIIGLTGDIKQIDEVIKKYRIYKNKVSSSDDDNYYTIDHTSLFYLIDKDDNYITHFGRNHFVNEFTELISDIKND